MIKLKKVRPMFCGVLTTADKYEETQYTEGGIIDASHLEGTAKEYQTVLSVGSSVREVKPGDVVVINPARFVRKRYDKNSIQNDLDNNPIISIEIPTLEINGKECFLVDDRDIMYVVEEYDEEANEFFNKDSSSIKIIQQKQPKIIV